MYLIGASLDFEALMREFCIYTIVSEITQVTSYLYHR